LQYGTGDEYQGAFEGSLRHGRGVFIYESGKRLEGNWAEGVFMNHC
jgi:hypothetical protein